jgi:2-isopropylmalate synthase
MKGAKISIYDTTMRDGAQGEGVHFTVKDKILYLQMMYNSGIDYFEAGWPGSNPKDDELFELIASKGIVLPQKSRTKRSPRIAAFGSTCKVSESPENSEILNKLIAAGTDTVTIFGKTWGLHVTEVLRTTMEENLRIIRESVAFLVKAGKEVIFDAEHFFDGWL